MSIQELKNLREQAWIRTPLGDKFSLHFDDTLYLQLLAQHFQQQVASFHCTSIPNGTPDKYAAGYEHGYTAAVEQITQHLRTKYAP